MAAPKSEITISVILSTYNHPKWLEKVLWGYEMQTYKHFEIIIADDGSGQETKHLIDRFRDEGKLSITHVWHEDNGFQKSQILNKAIEASQTAYLLFSDGDCIPRKDFVEVHGKNKKGGHFISGGYFMLPMETSEFITKEHIEKQAVFDRAWLYSHGVKKTFKINKLSSSKFLQRFLNFITPTKATWNGHNSSGWKNDIVTVNGFDERMQYGGQDRELGERLVNFGVKPIQLRYGAAVVHLDHNRGYKTKESIEKNKAIRRNTRDKKLIFTPFGLVKRDGN
ncbi:glycosyltransferase family 2 protein [Pelobium manganitolerans]|uniref:glycosyltransferase family 2 protein n=1 Tax=Pelobium manganitolerans TaxID=1842495 RepID=UPI003FA35B25